jgi:hypothetical protein
MLLILVAGPALGAGRSEAAVKNATDIPFMYVSQYAGRYSFRYGYTVPSGGQTQTDTSTYVWDTEVLDLITPQKNGKFHEEVQRGLAVSGYRYVAGNQIVPPNASCDYTYKPLLRTVWQREGSYSEAVPLKRNPTTTVTWSVPQPGVSEPDGIATFPFNVITEPGPTASGTLCNTNASPVTTDNFLGYTLGGCGACNFSYSLGQKLGQPSATFRKLWSGSQVVPLKNILKKSFAKNFKVDWTKTATTGSAAANSLVQETATLKVRSSVRFWRETSPLEALRAKQPGDKTGTLLYQDGLMLLGHITDSTDLPVQTRLQDPGFGLGFGNGAPETVLLPGIPEAGTVTTDVSGTVVPGGTPPAVDARSAGGRAARAAIVLGHGRAKTDPTGGMIALKLTPTAAGARLLSATHGSIRLKITLTFKPTRGRSTTRTVTGTALATSPG